MAAITSRINDLWRRLGFRRAADAPHLTVADRPEHDQPHARGENPEPEGEGPHRSGLLARLPGAKRDAAIAQLQQDYHEVVDLIRAVRQHLDSQSQRSQQLVDLMQRLPEALQTLPETNRNQARMLEAMQLHFEQANRHSGRLSDAINGLAGATEHHNQVMGMLQGQFDAARTSEQQATAAFTGLNDTLRHLGDSAQASTSAMHHIAQRTASTERRLEELVQRSTRQMTILSITGWAIAAIALGAAMFAIFGQ